MHAQVSGTNDIGAEGEVRVQEMWLMRKEGGWNSKAIMCLTTDGQQQETEHRTQNKRVDERVENGGRKAIKTRDWCQDIRDKRDEVVHTRK